MTVGSILILDSPLVARSSHGEGDERYAAYSIQILIKKDNSATSIIINNYNNYGHFFPLTTLHAETKEMVLLLDAGFVPSKEFSTPGTLDAIQGDAQHPGVIHVFVHLTLISNL